MATNRWVTENGITRPVPPKKKPEKACFFKCENCGKVWAGDGDSRMWSFDAFCNCGELLPPFPTPASELEEEWQLEPASEV